MTEQPTLFGEEPQPPPTTREPAPWVKRHGHNTGGYSTGCRCAPCVEAWRDYNNLIRQGLRRCQHCSNTYPRTTGGGTKFCAQCLAPHDCCPNGVYWRNAPKKKPPDRTCARCKTSYRKADNARWDLCPTCTRHPVFDRMKGALGQHHAPVTVVLAVMDWPYCANEQCGAWLLQRAHHKRHDRGSSRLTYNFVIDHDHACCPGDRSCGQCIRGLICRPCNVAMPHTLDTAKAQGIVDYLTNYSRR